MHKASASPWHREGEASGPEQRPGQAPLARPGTPARPRLKATRACCSYRCCVRPSKCHALREIFKSTSEWKKRLLFPSNFAESWTPCFSLLGVARPRLFSETTKSSHEAPAVRPSPPPKHTTLHPTRLTQAGRCWPRSSRLMNSRSCSRNSKAASRRPSFPRRFRRHHIQSKAPSSSQVMLSPR